MQELPTWIAEQQVVFVDAQGGRRAGRIAVGLPAVESPGCAACRVALDSHFSTPVPVYGESTLQALLLAAGLLGRLLADFVAAGGRVLDASDDSEVPLAALFGPLLRAPEEHSLGG